MTKKNNVVDAGIAVLIVMLSAMVGSLIGAGFEIALDQRNEINKKTGEINKKT